VQCSIKTVPSLLNGAKSIINKQEMNKDIKHNDAANTGCFHIPSSFSTLKDIFVCQITQGQLITNFWVDNH
jgi:hypothetical protein